jgi:mono/diheme cytochrome c family protein
VTSAVPGRRWPAAGAALCALLLWAITAAAGTRAERGRYLAAAGGCISCHTQDRDGAVAFAGGRPLATAFGTFYAPNITPDRDTGIGAWSDQQFLAALRDGVSPSGDDYFPTFPYTAYAGLSDADALAIKAYLFTLPAVRQPNRPHDLRWYLQSRLAATAWKWLYFEPARFEPDPTRDAQWNRGAYLVRHLGHCGECHTPRNRFGSLRAEYEMAGNPDGPEDRTVPNITPEEVEGIGDWSASDLETFLEIGMLPDGDFAGAGMGQVIDENTSQLTAEDRRAIAAYLRGLPPRRTAQD